MDGSSARISPLPLACVCLSSSVIDSQFLHISYIISQAASALQARSRTLSTASNDFRQSTDFALCNYLPEIMPRAYPSTNFSRKHACNQVRNGLYISCKVHAHTPLAAPTLPPSPSQARWASHRISESSQLFRLPGGPWMRLPST